MAAESSTTLTVRAVAARLQASPMALYRYFDTMDALLDALLDRVLGRFTAPAPTDDWVHDLGAFARAHRAVLSAHPWTVAILFSHPSPGINATVIGEEALRILQRGSISGARAVATFSAVLALNYGWSAFATARGDADAGPAASVAEALAAIPVEAFPLTVGVAAQFAAYGSDEHYELALAQLLSGIRAAAG